MAKTLDLITIGRSSVDLYGTQVGCRLEDMGSFEKYIGGTPAIIAAGTARLGLKSALITRVGDEPMGRFIREELLREGVDVSGVTTDPDRLTGLSLLGIRDQIRVPQIHFRETCADMALSEKDVDPAFISSARAVVATGTHLFNPCTEAAVLKALRVARDAGAQIVLDFDYCPNLCGLAGRGDGENRFTDSAAVTAKLQKTLPLFDLIVGTEQEFRIAGGRTDTIAALRAVRALTKATLVCARGPMAAAAFTCDIPKTLDAGECGADFAVEVFNSPGAGGAFIAGLLKGWLDGEPWPRTLSYANACGAIAASRQGSVPAYPNWRELQLFLKRGVKERVFSKDSKLEHVHWATNRTGDWSTMRVFAFDHRMQLEDMADAAGISHDRIGAFKSLCLTAAAKVANGRSGYGLLCDGRLGRDALYEAEGQGLWIGRPVEWPGSRPLVLEPEIGPDFGGLNQWPKDHVVKVLCFYHPDDSGDLKAAQEETVKRLFSATRRNRLEFLLEVIPSKVGPVDDNTTGKIIQRFYDIGVYPDWWKLEPLKTEAAWRNATTAITRNDPDTRGIVVLGLDAPAQELFDSFATATKFPLVKGFAVGRTIFGDVAKRWLAGKITDEQAVTEMQGNYTDMCKVWDQARADAQGKAARPTSDSSRSWKSQ